MKKAFRWLHKPYETDFIIIEAPCNFLLSIFYFQIYHFNLWWNNPKTMASTCFHRSSRKQCDYVHTKKKKLCSISSTDWISFIRLILSQRQAETGGDVIFERRKLDKKRVTFIWLSPYAYFQVHAQLKTTRTQESCSSIRLHFTEWSFCVAKTPKN